MNFSTKFLLITLLMFLFVPCIQAQQESGQVHGIITDETTGGSLAGATVALKGTSLGAASDNAGKYTIPRVSPGSYTLIVRYIGYRTVEKAVEISEGAKLEMNFALTGEAIEGETVTITAQAQGQRGAINQQLASKTITNVVSAEKIHALPDETAATALSRLPGISLMDGDKVVIRGIQAKMNVVLVNGVQLPSTDMADRSTNLGFISSNLLSGIEVTKVVTPDMDANTIGGVINLKLREAPEDWHFDLLAQGSYNTQDHTTPLQDNLQLWGSISNRFFDNALGVFVQANARRVNGGNDIAGATWKTDGRAADWGPGQASYGMDLFGFYDEVNIVSDYGGSVILDYVLPHGKLVFQNTVAYTNNNLARHRDVADLENLRRYYTVTRDIYDKELLVNTLQGEHSLFSDITVDFGLSHAYSKKTTDLRYGDEADDPPFDFSSALAAYPEPDLLKITLEDAYDFPFYADDWQVAAIEQFARTRSEKFNERLATAYVNFKIPVTISSDISAEFKVGGKYSHSRRENDSDLRIARATEPTNNRGAAEFLRSIGQDPNVKLAFEYFKDYEYEDLRGKYFLDGQHAMDNVLYLDYIDRYHRLASPEWDPGVHVGGSNRDDFTGWEGMTAGYVMGTFNVGPRITLLGGVRYEQLRMKYDAKFVAISHTVDGDARIVDALNTSDRIQKNWFPNAQLRYKLTEWCDIRLAYSNTCSRPDYLAQLPNKVLDNGSNTGAAGNPGLKPAIAKNYDAYISFYNNTIGLFTVGGFYKKIDDVFYRGERLWNVIRKEIGYPDSAAFIALGLTPLGQWARCTTYVNNPDPAYVHGFELEWQSNFWYLPKPFNLLVLNINYTRVWSEMDYEQVNIKSRLTPPPIIRRVYYEEDTIRTARLLNQADHVLNIAMGADYKGFSGRVSFRLIGDVITSVGSRPELDQFTGNQYAWDFTIKQQLLERVSMFLNGYNITHSPQKDYRKFRRDSDQPIKDYLSRITYSPTRYELGVRYSL